MGVVDTIPDLNHISDLSYRPSGYFSRYRKEMMEFVPSEARRILDVGCGTGGFGTLIRERQECELWGVESDSHAAKAAEERFHRVLNGDISEILHALPKGHFDCVVFNDVLEHLIDPYMVLSVIKENLSSDGSIVCSIPNVRHVSVLYDLIVSKQWRYEEEGILDKTHLRFFTKKSIVDMFTMLGYDVLRIEGINAKTSRKAKLLIMLTLGLLSDTEFQQFGCIAKRKR